MLSDRITGKGKYDWMYFTNPQPEIFRLEEKKVKFDDFKKTMNIPLSEDSTTEYNKLETIAKEYADQNNLKFKSNLLEKNYISVSLRHIVKDNTETFEPINFLIREPKRKVEQEYYDQVFEKRVSYHSKHFQAKLEKYDLEEWFTFGL